MATVSDTISIGILATLLGPFKSMGEDGLRGAHLALSEFGGQVAGKRIRIVEKATNAIPDQAYDMAKELIEEDSVDFIVGPLSGNEGLAVREYARLQPDRAFLNGTSGAQELTILNGAPNFYNFCHTGLQMIAGLAPYVYEQLGYKRVATLGEDYSYLHAQVGGFMLEFCRIGGKVATNFWVPLGTITYTDVIKAIPKDIDALLVTLGGEDALNFFAQCESAGVRVPFIGGSITIDQTILSAHPSYVEHLIGTPCGGMMADNNPDINWQTFVQNYRQHFPKGLNFPSMFTLGYYLNTKAALLALQTANGDLSKGQQSFMTILAGLEFSGPCGAVKLDRYHQVIANSFVSILDQRQDGTLYTKLARVINNVNQTLGLPEEEYLGLGVFSSRNLPNCA